MNEAINLMRNTLCQLTGRFNKMVTRRNRELSFKDIMFFLSKHAKSNSNTIANNDLKKKSQKYQTLQSVKKEIIFIFPYLRNLIKYS
jgi:hypothetical protein